jgi:hypothetical protein
VIYDPRDPDQHWNQPATWKWSCNPVWVWLDVLRHADGLGLPWSMFEPAIDVWIAAADYCDQIRPTKDGGSELWFRIAGAYKLTDPPKRWLPAMLDVADGQLSLRGDGCIVPSIGRWQEPEVTITDGEVYSYTDFAKGRAKPDIRNQINATFISSVYNYIEQSADPTINADSISVDGYQPLDMDLTWCPSHAQAKVRMKIEAARQNPEAWCGTLILNAYGLKLLNQNTDGSPRRFVRLQLSDFGLDSTFEILKRTVDPKSATVTIAVQEMTADAYDWNADEDEGTAPLIGLDKSAADVENPYNMQVSVGGVVITVTLDTPLDDTELHLQLEWRVSDDAVGDRDATWTALTLDGWGGHTDNMTAGRYDIRALYYNEESPPDYSDPLFIRGVIMSRFAESRGPHDLTTESSGDTIITEGGDTITTEGS